MIAYIWLPVYYYTYMSSCIWLSCIWSYIWLQTYDNHVYDCIYMIIMYMIACIWLNMYMTVCRVIYDSVWSYIWCSIWSHIWACQIIIYTANPWDDEVLNKLTGRLTQLKICMTNNKSNVWIDQNSRYLMKISTVWPLPEFLKLNNSNSQYLWIGNEFSM